MRPLELYRADFDELVDLVWYFYNKRSVSPTRSHLRALYNSLVQSQTKYWTTFTIEKEDIEQQLRLLWLKYEKKYYKKKRRNGLRDYILQCSAFGLLTWYGNELAACSHSTSPSVKVLETRVLDFELNLEFLKNGTDYWPLCNLSPYERYLVFLRFKEDKSIVDIAYVVQKHREVVSRQLNGIINKLRSNVNAS